MNEDLENPQLQENIKFIEKNRKQSRFLTRTLSIFFTVNIVLTLGVLWVALQVRSNSDNLTSQKRENTILCKSVNESNTTQRKLWDYLFAASEITPTPEKDPPTPEEIKQLELFKAYVDIAFKQRDC